MSLALASSTQATYSSAVNQFLNFCMQNGVQPLPADKHTLVYFAVALSQTLLIPTIKVYLSAVGSLHRHQGFKDPSHHNPQLKMVLQGTQQANLDKTSDIICTDTTTVNCYTLEKGWNIIAQEPCSSP